MSGIAFGQEAVDPLRHSFGLTQFHMGGTLALNWRNLGPRQPGFEQQIQNEVFISDAFFGFGGPVIDGIPFFLEFQMPTGSQGTLSLYRFAFNFLKEKHLNLEMGKFLVPFGHYNEIYRPNDFLAVTRPLLYASPDSLDLVVRLNSPRPPLSSGYTDIGARISYYPYYSHPLMPTEAAVYVVNGLGEASNRQRTFPSPSSLLVPPPPVEGVSIDFGHQNNNLADNNNNKSGGMRLCFALGDFRLPWTMPESQGEIKGLNVGFSVMEGRYDLEQGQDYVVAGVDARFQYRDFSVNAEYIYSDTDFKSPQADTSTVVSSPLDTSSMRSSNEINRGFYIQVAFPIFSRPPLGKKLIGVLVYNYMERRGPKLIFSSNAKFGPTGNLSVAAFPSEALRITTHINKYTLALNHKLSDNFHLKGEYSYWDISVPPVSNVSQTSIYQTAFSVVFSF
ncbi:MAG: hypothetical protein HY400_07335 [Elusimicrobia bacterium]|nr:hypothetical protein [Elusimicrobiota bacterium]